MPPIKIFLSAIVVLLLLSAVSIPKAPLYPLGKYCNAMRLVVALLTFFIAAAVYFRVHLDDGDALGSAGHPP